MPIIDDTYHIAIIGGGLSGFACAMEAAGSGKKVLLVERRPTLGWESTWSCQLDLSGRHSPINRKIKDELSKVGGFRANRGDAPILEMVLNRMAEESGVVILLYSYPVRLIYEDDAALGVVIGNKSGEQIIRAEVIVDATEEAILWRQTDVKFQKVIPAARQVFFFNHIEGELSLPLTLDKGINLYPSVWGGEVCVEFEIDKYDPFLAMRKLPEIINVVRSEVPQLKDALVSHAGNEPFPVSSMISFDNMSIRHPGLRNFFGAGPWVSEKDIGPADRLALGQEVGRMASDCEGFKIKDVMTGSFIGQPESSSDVLVIGGGTSGAIAAMASGQSGVKTTLIEASPCLGGIGTGGAIHSYYYGVRGGIQDEVDKRIKDITPLFLGKWKVGGFHPVVKKLVLQQMVEEAGVEIFLNTVVTGVLYEGGRVQGGIQDKTEKSIAIPEQGKRNKLLSVIAVGPEGIATYRAKEFIDSTGDGDIAVMAGAPYIMGRDKDNLPHAYSQSSGRLDQNGNLGHNNFDAGYVDPSDVEDLTRARLLGVRQYWRDKFARESRLLYLAPIIGLRQSRQIVGEYQMTLADEIAGRRFEDAISFTVAHYDNHHHDYENESDEAALWVWALGNWGERIGCEVPYRSLIPKNVENLMVACRALSITYDAHMEFRMQNDMQRIGEVAGIAAAMAVKKGVYPREIDIKELQSILNKSGILDEQYRPKPAIQERRILELPAGSHNLDPGQTKELVWISAHSSPENALVLRNMLDSPDPQVRFRASAALAWHGLDDGVPELIKCVTERSMDKTEGRREVPFWQGAITFLGMSRNKEAVPVLIDVLKDKDAGLDALIGAVRSLGRIGDKSAIPDLWNLLKREDLPRIRTMNSGMKTVEDAKWQLDLSTAEALMKLGAAKDEVQNIIEPYLKDNRAYVRRYASKLMQMEASSQSV